MKKKVKREIDLSIYSTVTADLKSESTNSILVTKQGDVNSRLFTVKLTIDGQEYIIPPNITARYAITKPYKTAIWNDCDKIEDNIIYGKLTSEALKNAGTFPMQIELYSETEKLSTANFLLQVLPSSRIADEQVGDNEYGVLDNLIHRTNESIENSNSVIEDMRNLKNELISNENERKQSEEERKSSENIRIENEKKRQQDTANAIKNAEAATEKANTSSTNADLATDRANKAAERCEQIANNFINDNVVEDTTTWSSKKINEEFTSFRNDIEASLEEITKPEVDALFNK